LLAQRFEQTGPRVQGATSSDSSSSFVPCTVLAPSSPPSAPPPVPPPAPAPQLTPPPSNQSGRPTRTIRIPRRFIDELPSAPVSDPPIPLIPVVRRVILHVREYFRTGLDQFRILHEYIHRRPSYDPDAHMPPEDLANFPMDSPADLTMEITGNHPPPWPFSNMSKYLLMNWYHTGSLQKSEAEVTRLAKEVICNPDFRPEDLSGFSVHQENKSLDSAITAPANAPFLDDSWREISVEIEVPIAVKNGPFHVFHVPGFHYRSIVQTIRATWGTVAASRFHLTPFRKIHVDQMGKETRIFDELYTSESWEVAHDQLQKQPPEPGCKFEKVIAALMFWSDSTRLAQFGTASVWPLYMYFGNLSKYTRAKPNSGACHHVAYIPSVASSLL
jgi:Plavaka transposase